MITINKPSGYKILELGGGANRHPASDVNVDVRPAIGVDFTADFDNMPLPIQSDEWDCVLSIFCIEHLSWRKVKPFLADIHRILKPGGKTVIVTANTEAQMKKVLANTGDWGDEESRIIFGDLDYPENSHKNSLCPRYAVKLFAEAGFVDVTIRPYGEIQTDMCVEARKPLGTGPIVSGMGRLAEGESVDTMPLRPQFGQKILPDGRVVPVLQEPVGATFMPDAVVDESPEAKFNSKYFNGGAYNPFYWDFPSNHAIARQVLARKPESVLELGCGRGYVLKRLQDAGIRAAGIDVSKHCFLTRACDGIVTRDLCKTPWPDAYRIGDIMRIEHPKYDLCFSQSFLEHVPEKDLPALFSEMERTCKRGLHGVTFADRDDGKDRTRVTLRDRAWWQRMLPRGHEVVGRDELEAGGIPEDVLKGDGRIKANVGCYMTQIHHGWTNLDVFDLAPFSQANGYNFQRCDARQGLPFNTGTVDLIACCHMLEHLTYAEGLQFLRECRRVLKPDVGAIRILVPDAEKLIAKYEWIASEYDERNEPIVGSRSGLNEYGAMNDGCAEAPTPAGKLWALLLEAHHSIYDYETLAWYLEQAGFVPKLSAFRDDERFKEAIDMAPCLSLIVTGTPLVG